MRTVHMMIGIQGSGKTTYSRELSKKTGISIVSSDEIRNSVANIEEKDVFSVVYKMCADLIRNGKDLIYDATNVTPNVRQRFWEKMIEHGVTDFKVIAYYFITDVEVCVNRVEQRNKDPNERFLPLSVVRNYAKNFIPPTMEEGFSEIITINY